MVTGMEEYLLIKMETNSMKSGKMETRSNLLLENE